ncbi:MAG TPA: DUF2007 domain-containing protein [Gaiellaceae bacterium]|jgi:Putative prokaryotic signal transducing protein
MEEAHLTVVASGIEAEMLCGLLSAEGIICFSRATDQGAGSMYGAPRGFGATEIVVRASDLERARELLAAGDENP